MGVTSVGTDSRRALAVLVVAACATVGALGFGAGAASAETLSAECATLQAQIKAASEKKNHGEGVVVVLKGLCISGFTIPASSNFTIEGAAGTTSGFNGTGNPGQLLSGSGIGTLTLANLTFEHATTTNAPPVGLRAKHVTLRGDSFSENLQEGTTVGNGGALYVEIEGGVTCSTASGPVALDITGTTFDANELKVSGGTGVGGGAAFVVDECTASAAVLEGDRFEGNTLEVTASIEAEGGALDVAASATAPPLQLRQVGNVFDSNRLLAPSGIDSRGGGGEWLQGVSLTSIGDRFSRNSLAGTSGTHHWSWGGGLGIINTGCTEEHPTESTLEDDVVAGNSIGSGEAADLGGAGIYVGCSPVATVPNHLTLLDSTVTGNTVPSGGIAGIDGHESDALKIENSIVAADSGGEEIGGFNGAGGALSAAFSDVCRGAAALAGEGDICADPKLADDGNPASFDVHETASSPTIDAGSNALVPSTLTSDFYGEPRIRSGRSYIPACTPGETAVGPTATPAVVDMGAAEFGPVAVPAIAYLCPKLSPHPSVFAFPTARVRANGLLALTFKGPGKGTLEVLGTFKLTRKVFARVHGKRRRVSRIETVLYGRASKTLRTTRNVTVDLKPTAHALALLKQHRKLRVLLSITFTGVGETPTTHTQTITVKYVRPRRGRR